MYYLCNLKINLEIELIKTELITQNAKVYKRNGSGTITVSQENIQRGQTFGFSVVARVFQAEQQGEQGPREVKRTQLPLSFPGHLVLVNPVLPRSQQFVSLLK